MIGNLYSQTPNAIHMGGGYSNLGAYYDPMLGTPFGYNAYGNAMGNFAAAAPSRMLAIGNMAATAANFGIGGNTMRALGTGLTLGTAGLPFAAAAVPQLALMTAASRFRAGGEQQMFAQNALQSVVGERNLGGNMGFGASREAAKGFAQVFQQLSASTETLTNDVELKALFNKFNDMSLFQTVRAASDIGSRFKKLVTTVRDISRDLGTTLEGVMPIFQRQVQMGFIDPEEIQTSIRTNRALRGVGIGSSDATITGLQMAQSASNFAAGGTRKFGALGAQKNLALVNVALEKGIITDEDLMNSTGQIGERGAADLAQQFMQASRNALTNDSSYGKMIAAFLGETDKEGRFTGKLDRSALNQFQTMSYDDLDSIVNKKLSSKAGAESFISRMDSGMGADIASQLSGGDVGRVFEMMFEQGEADSKEAMHILMKGITGQRGKTVDVMMKLMGEQQGIMQEVARQTVEKSVRNRLPSLIEERFSIGGRLNRAYRQYIDQPLTTINEYGSSASAQAGKYFDNIARQTLTGGFTGFAKSLTGSGVGEQFTGESLESRRQFLADEYAFDNMGESTISKGPSALDMGARGVIGAGLVKTGLGMSTTGLGALIGIPMATIGGFMAHSAMEDFNTNRRGDVSYEQAFEDDFENVGGLSGKDLRTMLSEDFSSSNIDSASKKNLINKLRLARANNYKGRALVEEVFGGTDGGNIRGGNYGIAMSLSQDKTLSKKEQAHFLSLAQTMREGVYEEVAKNQDSYAGLSLASLSKEMSGGLFGGGLIESGTGGLRNEFFGGEYDQIENEALNELWENGESHKIQQIMRLLMDPDKLGELADMDATPKDLQKYFDAQGIKLTEGQASSIYDLAKDAIRTGDGDKVQAAENIKGVGERIVQVARSRATITSKNKQKIAARKALTSGATNLGQALNTLSGGNTREARKKIENLLKTDKKKAKEELDKLDAVTKGSFKRYFDLVKMDDDKFRDFMIEDFKGTSLEGKIKDMDPEELRDLALRRSLSSMDYVEEDNSMQAALGLGDSGKVAEIIKDVNKTILNQLGDSQKVTSKYIHEVNEAIRKLNERIPT